MSRTPSFDLDRAVAAIYALAPSADAWLAGVRDALASLDQGMGVAAYFVDVSAPGRFASWSFQPPEVEPMFRVWEQLCPTYFKHAIHKELRFGVVSQLAPFASPSDLGVFMNELGVGDMLGINGIGPDGRGVAVAAPSPRRLRPPTGKRAAMFEALTWHLGRGARLALADHPPAVPPPVTADAAPVDRVARDALRTAALAELAHAHGHSRATHESWARLQDHRLVLVDSFEHAGQRVLLAVEPGYYEGTFEVLSDREIAAVRLAADGRSNKVIAAELGVSLSTVSTLLKRACEKVGVPTRPALIARFLAASSGSHAIFMADPRTRRAP